MKTGLAEQFPHILIGSGRFDFPGTVSFALYWLREIETEIFQIKEVLFTNPTHDTA